MLEGTHQKALLLLADDTCFQGISIGKQGTTSGEICFNTGMTGYQEIYTDPSYYGQIIVNTAAHIGNYGILPQETESENIKIRGVVVKYFSSVYSRMTSKASLQDYLQGGNIVGIAGIDTRKLVRHIREKGAMNAVISSEITDKKDLQAILAKTPDMSGLELASQVSTAVPYTVGNSSSTYKVAVLDLGVKKNILSNFVQRDCHCKIFPAKTTYIEMQAYKPDGYFISNGPGDPASMDYAVETIQAIIADDKPLFGICLGHQLLCLSQDIPTFKMHNGHRGLNHPVKNIETNHCEITSQNHGFGIDSESVKKHKGLALTHTNLNDGSIEGIRIKGKKAFSVQYHPESSPGPHDSRYLFDRFVALMKR